MHSTCDELAPVLMRMTKLRRANASSPFSLYLYKLRRLLFGAGHGFLLYWSWRLGRLFVNFARDTSSVGFFVSEPFGHFRLFTSDLLRFLDTEPVRVDILDFVHRDAFCKRHVSS